MVTFDDVKNNEEIRTYVVRADKYLEQIGYTEHSFSHLMRVSDVTSYILCELGYSDHDVELARIAGYLHDIGNLVNRDDHAQTGALLSFGLLRDMGMPYEDISDIVTAIGNHDEHTGSAVSPLAAALIIADKSDVRRGRVRNSDISKFDIHDRVNYSAESYDLRVDGTEKVITLMLTVDTSIGSVMEYFEIFLGRMNMCKGAAEKLGVRFKLYINCQLLM